MYAGRHQSIAIDADVDLEFVLSYIYICTYEYSKPLMSEVAALRSCKPECSLEAPGPAKPNSIPDVVHVQAISF